MTIEEALRKYLLSREAITDLVGERITQGLAPQGDDRPFISYDLADGDHNYHLEGVSTLAKARVDIACTSADYLEARAVYDALRNSLDGFRHGEWGEVWIDSAFLEPPSTGRGRPRHGKDRPISFIETTLEVNYHQPEPSHL